MRLKTGEVLYEKSYMSPRPPPKISLRHDHDWTRGNDELDKIHWGKNSWRRLSLVGDETVINLQRAKVYVFSDSVLCFGRIFQHPDSNEAWKNRIAGVKAVKSYRDYDGINGEPTEFEWNIFPGFTTLQFCGKINVF